MQKLNVAVLRGGPSSEYDISLITGAAIIKNLDEKKYTVHDILIDKQGAWHRQGVAKKPADALRNIDVAVLGLHGEFGEDGKVQQILDAIHVPYTGSGAVASALAMNKTLSKKIFKKAGLKIAEQILVDATKDLAAQAQKIFKTFPLPVVVKPNATGSSVGITIAHDFETLYKGIVEASRFGDAILVEQYIRGREATCGVLDNFRGQEHYALLPVEIIPPAKSGFFNREVKYNGETKEICPGNFDKKTTQKLQDMAVTAHTALGLRDYSRSDFIVTDKNEVYILETNSLPGMTPESLLPKSLIAVGSSFAELMDHLITLAQQRH